MKRKGNVASTGTTSKNGNEESNITKDDDEETRIFAELHSNVLAHLETFRQLPMTMAEKERQRRGGDIGVEEGECSPHDRRFFLPYSVSPSFNPGAGTTEEVPPLSQQHRSDFILPLLHNDDITSMVANNGNIDGSVEKSPMFSVIRNVLNRNNQTNLCILQQTLGQNAELCEVSVIITEPGAVAQPIHSDGDYIPCQNYSGNDNDNNNNNNNNDYSSSPKIITLFIALHDILEEGLGGTKFVLKTHHPKCFPRQEHDNDHGHGHDHEEKSNDENSANQVLNSSGTTTYEWLHPTEERVRERELIWFPMEAGDVAIMYSTTWHGGGANVDHEEGRKRCILAVTFIEGPKRLTTKRSAHGANSVGTSRVRRSGRKKAFIKKSFTLDDFREK